MRGDFSRIRFSRRKNYTAVLEQQGRVALDADANEQQFIDAYESRTQTIDAIGQFGGPAGDEGFDITVPDDNTILIGPGRYYVNGLLCENPASLSYDDQPHLIDPGHSASSLLGALGQAGEGSVLQVYLEVWQRLVTALDDPGLREPALGQADTTARLETVWRVVADLMAAPQAQSGQEGPVPSCCQGMYAAPAPPSSTGTLTAGLSGPSAECGCGPVAAAGYQGIENQLYRVEIHTGTAGGTQPTWKWSRENGSVVTAITKVSGATVWVSPLPPDTNLGFQPGQWVELTDDALEFGQPPNSPGTLYQIQTAPQLTDPNPSFTLAVPDNQPISVNPARHARMRRWDMFGSTVTATGIPVSPGWTQLENGIQVMFGPAQSGPGPVTSPPPGTFQSGDYWTIPARTATGQIEWPQGSGGNAAERPASIQVYRAPLACIHVTVIKEIFGNRVTEIFRYQRDDCRQAFSPLTALTPPVIKPAIHIASVSWVNDDLMTLDALIANGLTITLDQPPGPNCPLSGANVIVTVELAPQIAAVDLNLRAITIIDTAVTLNGSAITWQVPPNNRDLQEIIIRELNSSLFEGAFTQQWAKMRIRLLGQMIYATELAGLVYLDGLALGQPGGLRKDGVTPRIGLNLPSGAGLVASDFEGWLYLAPILQVIEVSANIPGAPPPPPSPSVTVIVNALNRVQGVFATGTSPPQAVTPVVEITVNYPVIADTTVTVVLSNTDGTNNGVGDVVSLPGTGTIPKGQVTSAPIPISVVSNPGPPPAGSQVTLSFNISASVTTQLGVPVSAVTAIPFSVVGVPPPHFLQSPTLGPQLPA